MKPFSTLLGVALVLFGVAGCGGNANEADFAETPGYVPPGLPQTAEEYEAKFRPKRGEY